MEHEKTTNLKEILSNSAKKYANKTIYKLENEEITYKQMQEKVNCLGTSLIEMGLKNKKIAIISENRYEWEIAYFAITCGTGIVVPIDKSLTKTEMITILKRAEIEAVFCSEKYEEILADVKKDLENLKYIISFDGKEIQSFNQLIENGNQLISLGNKEFIEAKIDNESVSFIMFTSGTTEKSKAVMLSHKNICTNLESVAQVFPMTSADIALCILPLNHVLEGLFCLLLTIFKGATRRYCNDLKDIIEDINKYKISFMGAVPAVYEYIYKKINEIKNENINIFMSGGASLSMEIERAFKDNGIHLVQGYGITETAPVVSMSNVDVYKIGSVGKAIPNIELRITDKDEEGVGEIAVKGENVFLGYYQDIETTKQVLKNGWFYTGDLAKIDDEGYIFLQGRLKNVIVLPNGKKVFPEEIEYIINKIKGVKESFVFAKKVSAAKMVICAEIVCKNIEYKQEILKQIEEINKNIPLYKQISITYITEEELLKTPTGKLKRKEELEKININNLINETIFVKSEIEDNKLQKKIKDIIGKQLGLENIDVQENVSFAQMGADSLDKVEIILAVEKEFVIKIKKEEYANINSIEDIIKHIKDKKV